jgi:Flp pilus assembly protein CpaB
MVAARDIPAYSIIVPDDLGAKQIPVGARANDSLHEPGAVIGKMTTATIFRGEQVIKARVTETHMNIGNNERVVAAGTDALVQSVGNTVTSGDMVDVYWVTSADTPGILLATNARVLEVKTAEGKTLSSATSRDNGAGQANVIVLIVKQGEVAQIARAVDSGKIFLAKQRPVESMVVPSPTPPALEPVEDAENEPGDEEPEEQEATVSQNKNSVFRLSSTIKESFFFTVHIGGQQDRELMANE